ncbi:MAG: sigma-54-dependent Fis family transcriptional regulator, partial [Aquificota bacterium]
TNKNLKKLVEKGKFREDLYYRLNVIHFELPPLRERKEDIPYIVECIINKNNKKINKNIKGFTKEYINKLKERKWKGNIRELENVVVRSMVFCRDSILSLTDLNFLEEEKETKENLDNDFDRKLKEIIKTYVRNGNIKNFEENIEKTILKTVLEETKYNLSKAADILGINRGTLRKKIKQFNLI